MFDSLFEKMSVHKPEVPIDTDKSKNKDKETPTIKIKSKAKRKATRKSIVLHTKKRRTTRKR
jgi:hypothetical protein